MQKQYSQSALPFIELQNRPPSSLASRTSGKGDNTLRSEDRAFHDWYRFVLSYPPHLVRDYIQDFELSGDSLILDPFCGTGTTVVEAKINGIRAVGLEANPFPHFASTVKSNWCIDPDELEDVASTIAENAYQSLLKQGIDDRALTCEPGTQLEILDSQAMRALIKNSISPLPLHKSLMLIKEINSYEDTEAHRYCKLAMGNALVSTIGNLRFGPEVGVGKIKRDVPIVSSWAHEIRKMVNDLRTVHDKSYPDAIVHLADARRIANFIPPNSIDAVITSPPYPNEKDYTRSTRLESVVLGYYENMSHLREFKKTLLRSNTRGVYKADDDDLWVTENDRIQQLADEIEARRIELGKTSGFEKMYARVTKLYFGGMVRHLTELTSVLKPGARLAYVVGDQASYLQIMIRTGQILAEIAEQIGYDVERIDLFRTRFASATKSELREEVLILRWPDNRL